MNEDFINYSYYTSFIILFTGLILFCKCNCILYYLLILLGLTSIFNHYHNKKEVDYNYTKWPIYRILDWSLVIIFLSYLYYCYYKEPIIYISILICSILYICILWCNMLHLHDESLRINHCITHIILIFLVIYLYFFSYNTLS